MSQQPRTTRTRRGPRIASRSPSTLTSTPNISLIVDESPSDDNSAIGLSQATMDGLNIFRGVFRGDTVLLKGKLGREAVCIALHESRCPDNKIFMNRVVRNNLGVVLGDCVTIGSCPDVRYGKRVHILPIRDTVVGLTGNIFELYLKRYFLAAYRPIHKGDIFSVSGAGRTVEFVVVWTNPFPFCIVASDTIIHCIGDPVKREEIEEIRNSIGYDSIGGYGEQVAEIKTILSLSLGSAGRPDLLRVTTGLRPPRGILLHGPPGTGKSLIARAAANESRSFFVAINGCEILNKVRDPEASLRKAFEKAEKNSPAIVFIDELDAIAPMREKTHGQAQRLVSDLMAFMDRVHQSSSFIVMAATNRRNAIDPALLRSGRFDTEIEIGIPDSNGRLEMLRIHTRRMKLCNDVDLEKIATEARGFVGADLAALCSEAALQQIRELDLDNDELNSEILNILEITMDSFRSALDKVAPRVLQATGIGVPKVTWTDVCGLDDAKRELKELLQHSLRYPNELPNGIQPCKSVLLYGPPGCGKTLLAKAIGNECQINFITVKSFQPNIRKFSDMARVAKPCIVFIDNLDSLARIRGEEAACLAHDTLNQLLNLLDEIKSTQNMFLLGTTSRPDLIEPSVLRPGRFDKLIYISLPNEKSRSAMFQVYLNKSPLSKDINMAYLAKRTRGYSGADIFAICQEAGRLAIRHSLETPADGGPSTSKRACLPTPTDLNDNVQEITKSHFEEALKHSRRSVTDKDVEKYEQFIRSH